MGWGGVCLGHGVTGGLCEELCRDPICQDLIPRPDGQGSWWKSYSEPNARLVLQGSRMAPVLPKLPAHCEGAMSALKDSVHSVVGPDMAQRGLPFALE